MGSIINSAINTVTDLAQGKPLDAVKDLVSTAAQAAPLAAGLLPGGPIISGLLGSALGGVGAGASGGIGGLGGILGAAGGLPSIASGLTSVLPGLGGLLGTIFPGGSPGGPPVAGGGTTGGGQTGLDGSTLGDLTKQFQNQLDFKKQFDAISNAFNMAFAIEDAKKSAADKVFNSMKLG